MHSRPVRIILSALIGLCIICNLSLPMVDCAVATGAAVAAIETGGTALQYMSMTTVPLQIMEKLLAGPLGCNDSAPGRPENKSDTGRQGLSLALPEPPVIRKAAPEMQSRGAGAPGLSSNYAPAMLRTSAAASGSAFVSSIFMIALMLARRSRPRGDTDAYFMLLKIYRRGPDAFGPRFSFAPGAIQ